MENELRKCDCCGKDRNISEFKPYFTKKDGRIYNYLSNTCNRCKEKPKRKRWEQVNKVGYAHVNNDFIFSSNIKHWH